MSDSGAFGMSVPRGPLCHNTSVDVSEHIESVCFSNPSGVGVCLLLSYRCYEAFIVRTNLISLNEGSERSAGAGLICVCVCVFSFLLIPTVPSLWVELLGHLWARDDTRSHTC